MSLLQSIEYGETKGSGHHVAVAHEISNWANKNNIQGLRKKDENDPIKFHCYTNQQRIRQSFSEISERKSESKKNSQWHSLFLMSDLVLKYKHAVCDDMVSIPFRFLAESKSEASFSIIALKDCHHVFAAIGLSEQTNGEKLPEIFYKGGIRESRNTDEIKFSELAKSNPEAVVIELWVPFGEPARVCSVIDYRPHILPWMNKHMLEMARSAVTIDQIDNVSILFHVPNVKLYQENLDITYVPEVEKALDGEMVKQDINKSLGFDIVRSISEQRKVWFTKPVPVTASITDKRYTFFDKKIPVTVIAATAVIATMFIAATTIIARL